MEYSTSRSRQEATCSLSRFRIDSVLDCLNSAGLSGEVRHLRRHPRMHRSRLACVVDHMIDRTVIAQRHGDHVMEPYLRVLRRLDGPGQHYVRINEDAVYAQPPRLMARDSIRNLVRGPAIHTRRARIASLVRRIVRNLGLIKICPAAIAVP